MTTPVPPTAVWIDQKTTRINPEYATTTPPDATARGLGEFLNRVDDFVAWPAATVMLDGTVPRQLGFTGGPPAPGQTGTEPLRRAREHGWEIREERVWMTAVRKEKNGHKERTIHIGIVPWLSPRTFELFAPHDPQLMQWRMYEWARMLGVPFHGEQLALAGHDVIRDRCTLKKNPKWLFPATDAIEPAHQTTELPYAWTGPQPTSGWVHQFDATAQHMAALGNVHVSGDLLQHRTPGDPVRRNPPGYYRVVPPPWLMPNYLPHPIGRLRDDTTSPIWVTHVTLDFLMELHEDYGIVDPPELLDSWTSDYRCRVFRKFGEILSRALRESATYKEDPVMHTAIKTVYKATVGLMARPGGRIYRPDWTHAVIAQARCDLWRKAWREGAKLQYRSTRSGDTLIGSGAWPVEFETDALWYASPTDQPNWPTTFMKGDGLTPGTFVVKKSRKADE